MANTVPGPASVAELTRSCKNNVDLINEWVYTNVSYRPMWGLYKGALATIIDRDAGPVEQSRLMVELLTEAGYTAGYVHGEIRLTKAQIEQLLGTDDSSEADTTENLLTKSRIPFTPFYSSGVLQYVDMEHVWVNVEIDGTPYQFDPSFKTHSYTNGIDIGAAMGWAPEPSGSLSGLRNAADPNTGGLPNYLTDFHTTDLIEDETDGFLVLATELLDTLRTEHFAAGMDQVIGGRSIETLSGTPIRQTSLPYVKPDTTPETWTEIPDTYRAILEISIDTIEEELFSDDIYGTRLTLTFNGSGQVQLKLGGNSLATGTTTFDEGTWEAVSFTVTHPFCEANVCGLNEEWAQSVQVGNTYLIGNAWGSSSQSMVEYHRTLLQENLADGGGDTDEDVLGEILAVYWSMRRAQNDQINYIYDQVATVQHFLFHFVGLVGYNPTDEVPSWDIGSTAIDVKSRNGTTSVEARILAATDLVSNGLEASVLQQSLPITGISAMKLLTEAAPTQKIFDANSSNWNTVKNLLTNWDSVTKEVMKAQTDAGSRLVIHEDGATTVGDFVGGGWYEISSSGTIYGWLQGEVVDPMAMRAASSPVRTLQFEVRQTKFTSYNAALF